MFVACVRGLHVAASSLIVVTYADLAVQHDSPMTAQDKVILEIGHSGAHHELEHRGLIRRGGTSLTEPSHGISTGKKLLLPTDAVPDAFGLEIDVPPVLALRAQGAVASQNLMKEPHSSVAVIATPVQTQASAPGGRRRPLRAASLDGLGGSFLSKVEAAITSNGAGSMGRRTAKAGSSEKALDRSDCRGHSCGNETIWNVALPTRPPTGTTKTPRFVQSFDEEGVMSEADLPWPWDKIVLAVVLGLGSTIGGVALLAYLALQLQKWLKTVKAGTGSEQDVRHSS